MQGPYAKLKGARSMSNPYMQLQAGLGGSNLGVMLRLQLQA